MSYLQRGVLLVEDSPSDAWLIRQSLENGGDKGFSVTHVERLAQAVHHLKVAHFDAVLLDLTLPDSRGIETFEHLRAVTDDAAIVVLTGLDDESLAEQAVAGGAQDYLVKGTVSGNLLRRQLLYAVERKQTELRMREFMRELERSNQDLESFASVASHDLRNPLNTAMMLGRVVLQRFGEKLPAEGRDYLQRQHEVLKRMAEMTSQLMKFAQVACNNAPHERVDLNDLLREVLADLGEAAMRHGGTVEIGELPAVRANRTQLRQLLLNLIANALKFRKPDTPPVVSVYAASAGSNPGRKAYVEIAVEDNGIGFDEGQLEHIFGIFGRLHAEDAYEGFGIGLALCRKIAEQHGGSITARSRPGEGATFFVRLPAA